MQVVQVVAVFPIKVVLIYIGLYDATKYNHQSIIRYTIAIAIVSFSINREVLEHNLNILYI